MPPAETGGIFLLDCWKKVSYNKKKSPVCGFAGVFFWKWGTFMYSENSKTNKLTAFLLVIVGNVLYTLSIKLFLLPANLISCGTTGIALIVEHLTSIPLSVTIFVVNVVMLLLGWRFLGRNFAMTTVFSSLFYPFFLEILNLTIGDVVVTEHIWLNVLFAGLGLGVSLGLVVRGGASTGGLDIPPLILQKYFRIPMSLTLATTDVLIVLGQAFFHPLEDLLLGILLIIIISVALNKATLMGTTKTEVRIISDKHEQISLAILTDVDRGLTLLHARGGYEQTDKEVIMTIISDYELPKIERIARSIDPACFMIVSQVKEVWGRGFTYGKVGEQPKENGQ